MAKLGKSTLTQEEKVEEARALIGIILDVPQSERDTRLRGQEPGFLESMQERLQYSNFYISDAQLFWLRDIKDRLL